MIELILEGRPTPHPRMTQGQVRALKIPEGRRRVTIPKQIIQYLDWKEEAGWRIKAEVGQPLLDGPLGFTVEVYAKGKLAGDASNYLKSLEDAANGLLWHDDRQIKQALVRLIEDRESDYVILRVWQLSDPHLHHVHIPLSLTEQIGVPA